ncbi:Ig-like domain-containing protein [Tessaracoccus lubricantis]|uniref:Ig-like domain-containing protein n=1 Tax=Tessaracoccus lubricantis TaxID=545543 RepID=A0ABP9FB85_9ACTN
MTDVDLGQTRQAARPIRIIARFLRRSWQAILVVVLAIALGVAAYLSPGLVQADVHLDEGMVFVGKRDGSLMGTVNAQIDELSAATPTGDSQFQLYQHQDDVQAFLPQSSNLHPYLPGRNILERATKMPPNAVVQQVEGSMLVYDQENGRVWYGTLDDMLDVDFLRDKPNLEVGEFGVATLTVDGDAIGLNPNTQTLVRLEGEAVVTTPVPIAFDAERRNFEISAVGDNAVVLDRNRGQIWVEGMPKAFAISGQSQALLLPPVADVLGGEDGARALFANAAGLGAITPDGFRSMSGNIRMVPVRPVQVAGCLYGAFYGGPGEGTFVKRCKGEEPVVTELEHLTTDGTSLQFQVNRTTVALNDMANGTVWLVDKGTVILPEDWSDVRPVVEREDSEYTEGDPTVLPERTPDNRPPIAKDDRLGARAGAATVLPVLDNDTDPDGDLLTISVPNDLQLDGATVQPVRGGAGLQITIDPSATGELAVPYIIDDGRDGTATATAHVTVHPAEPGAGNQPPVLRGKVDADVPAPQPLRVTMGDADVTYRALLDWRDPEGDPLVLVKAWMDPQFDDIVQFRPNGEITYTDVGTSFGLKTIHVEVADRHGNSTTDELQVMVHEEVIPPTTYGDFATTMQGESVTVEPLANDIRAINLTEVDAGDCTECVETSLADNRFTFTSDAVGAHYVKYSVNNGASGLVRVDVLPSLTNRPPVPVDDVAHLPAMGSVTIDPLLNDTDPDGDVLVIQTITDVPPTLNVTMERRTLLTIEATADLTGTEKFYYHVSDGSESRRGTIQVVATEASGQIGPRVEDDTLRVRAGATGSVKVLENDTSPDGRDLTIAPELVDNPFGDDAWVEGDTVRVSVPAGSPPGVSQVRYRAVDSTGEATDGIVRVTVVSEEASNAEPPQPRQVIDRVLAGTTTRIPIPLDGIDPQGDAVRLVGLGSIPSHGRVLKVGERYFEYEAFLASAGTDTFSYVVVDSHGVEARGEVRIGVAQPSKTNNKPIAVMDEISTRPGRQVQLDPLANDYDLDGDPIKFASEEPARMRDDIPVQLVDDRELVLTAPEEEGDYDGTYDIVDLRGEPNSGLIRLTVDEDAPLLPPVARDDLVDVAQLAEQQYVEIDPLANDYDPDGPREALTVELPGEDPDDDLAPRITEEGKVSIGVRDTMQQVRYVAVDEEGLGTSAVITVPGRGDVAPTLKDPSLEMTVRAGENLQITINEVVQGTDGREVELANVEHISARPDVAGSAVAVGNGVVEFQPLLQYQGPAAVVFEVRDVLPASETSTPRSAFISIPVTVLRARVSGSQNPNDPDYFVNQPPVLLTQNPVLEVGAAEEEQSIDVTAFFRDPEGDSIRLLERPRQIRGDAPIQWEERGNRIVARALDTARKGQSIVLSGRVLDGSVDANEAPFELTILVVASRFQKVSAKEVVVEVNAGSSLPVPVLGDNVVSYLPHDKQVFLEGARLVSGGGSVTADTGSGTVTVAPAPGWHGTMVVSYSVNDALRDPDRVVNGVIQVRVRDVPGQPGHPYDIMPGDGTVTFKYNSTGTGGDNAANVTGTALATGAGAPPAEGTCSRGICTIRGLQNGRAYTATVTEHNSVGPSEMSLPSALFYPDAKLLPPQVVQAATGDRGLTVSWVHNRITDSANGSSRVRGYRIHRYVAGVEQPDSPKEVGADSRAYWWGNLTNGQTSQFRVQALSDHAVVAQAGNFDSDPSELSNAEYPVGAPTGSITVTPTTIQDDIGGGFRVSFDTSQVDANGDPSISQYRVVPVTSGNRERTDRQAVVVNTGATTLQTTIHGMGTEATQFRVYATNRHSEVALGISPTPMVSWARPKITALEVTPGDGQLTVSVSHSMPRNSPGVVQYSVGDGWAQLPADGVIAPLVNGRLYQVQVKAVLDSMESAVETRTGLRPKGARPTPPSVASYYALDANTVRATLGGDLNDWEATNGWDPNSFEFCYGGGLRCSWTKERSGPVPYGEQVIRWRAGGQTFDSPGPIPSNASPPEEPWLDSSGRLSYRFSYLGSNSQCVAVFSRGGDSDTVTQNPSGDGVIYQPPIATTVQGDPVTVTPSPSEPGGPTPDPVVSQPPPEQANDVVVTCDINSTSLRWKLK